MTKEQELLVKELRIKLLKSGYPKIFVVTIKEIEAVEEYLREWLKERNAPPVLKCGKHGLYFKGCELVLEA